ncbi:MAG: nuclear transport factor 2 family protein [Luteibacter sp.]
MNTPEAIQLVQAAFAAIGRGDLHGLLALCADDVEWVVPGEWPLSGTHRGHAGVTALFQKAADAVETSFPQPPEFVGQGGRVLVVGVSTGKVKATNRSFEDHFVFAVTVRDGKVANIREYVDTLALARASAPP